MDMVNRKTNIVIFRESAQGRVSKAYDCEGMLTAGFLRTGSGGNPTSTVAQLVDTRGGTLFWRCRLVVSLELLHRFGFRLDEYEVDARFYLVPFGVGHVAFYIVAYFLLQARSHVYIVERREESDEFLCAVRQSFVVEKAGVYVHPVIGYTYILI